MTSDHARTKTLLLLAIIAVSVFGAFLVFEDISITGATTASSDTVSLPVEDDSYNTSVEIFRQEDKSNTNT